MNQNSIMRPMNLERAEADIKSFFDKVDFDWMVKFLEHDIADAYRVRYCDDFVCCFQYE